ncbi:DotA/TraY family protein [Acidithiobacillus thiooxidans]|uniref:DotA/TraY family protein n=1 Tax=Acidithiobacillus thiooxidans TaxID=930 RepID=UPI001C072B61|nr:DotA/TraY family protein [Acidithiobacillus thiooxidans]MBU2836688.1 DotA/TraY family protein [Acidithiobacillus thiooxidans]
MKNRFWWFLILVLISQPALAGNLGISPDTHDMFGQMLMQIVGTKPIHHLLGISKTDISVSAWTGYVVSLLAWLNSAVLFVGGILASYTIFGSWIKTAREGEVMGKWNEHTVPVRTLLGAAVLLPVPGFAGLSAIQLIVIWLFGFIGIGLADSGWTTVVKTLESHPDTAIGTLIVPTQNVRNLAKSIVDSQVCAHAVNEEADNLTHGMISDPITMSGPTTDALHTIIGTVEDNSGLSEPAMATSGIYVPVYKSYVWGTPGASVLHQMDFFPGLGMLAGATNVCGSLSYESTLKWTGNPDDVPESVGSQLREAVYKANASALPTLIKAVKTAASEPIEKDASPTSAKWNKAIGDYDKALEKPLKKKADDIFKKGIKAFAKKAKKYGFAMAGEWFWKINSWNQAAEKALDAATEGVVSAPSWGNFAGSLFSSHFEAEMKRAKAFADSAQSTGLGDASRTAPPPGDNSAIFGKYFSEAGVSTMNGIVESPKGQNPIEHVQSVGTTIELFAGSLFAVALLAVAAGGGADHSALAWIGAGAGGKVLVVIGKMLLTLAGLIFGMGYLLSFFIPLIPYIIWTITLLTTAILFIELVAAAPIWAVMHMHPEGHEFFGYGSSGYLLALSIVFRPVLMLAGFLAGTGLVYAFSWLLNATLGNALLSAMTDSGGGFLGPLDFVGGCVLYTFFLIMAVWKSYELIYVLPDKVMRWANARGAETDDAHLKQAMEGHGSKRGAHTDIADGAGKMHGTASGALNPPSANDAQS